jgi:hypothetical protein
VKPKPSVPRLWTGETVVCIASGPSLTREDVDFVRGKARVIVVNNNYQLAPWADVLYAADAAWWKWAYKGLNGHESFRAFRGLKYSLSAGAALFPGVQVLARGTTDGLALKPTQLATGSNSGYQAINLAYHLAGPQSRIVLLGYDMQRGSKGEEHWHANHPNPSRSAFAMWRRLFESLVQPLQAHGVEVINCTRRTALTCFPRRPIDEVFAAVPMEQVS